MGGYNTIRATVSGLITPGILFKGSDINNDEMLSEKELQEAIEKIL